MNRREFFSYLSMAWIAFTAAVGGMLGLIFRFTYPNVVFEPPTDFIAGFPDDYQGGVDERWKKGQGVWMVKMEGQLFALSNICTHLGCIPNWLSGELKFKCPCHGSGFYMSGVNFEGPAPRPLERYRVALNEKGEIVVDKSKKYRQEKGEWENPNSFLVV